MGKIDLSNFGISGKIGPVVAYVTKSGKQVFRKYTKPKNPQTQKQMAQRMKFALVTKGLSPLTTVFKQGYLTNKNARSSQVSKVLREGILGEYPNYKIDYSIIQVAEGKLQILTDISLTIDKDNYTAQFNWNPGTEYTSHSTREDDQVNVVCLNKKENKAINTQTSAMRADGTATLDLKEEFNNVENCDFKDLHFWVYMSSFYLGQNSNSVYVKREL